MRSGSVEAIAHVLLGPTTTAAEFEEHLRSDQPAVVHAWHLAGDADLEVHLICDTLKALQEALSRMRRDGGADKVVSQFVLRPVTGLAGDPTPSPARRSRQLTAVDAAHPARTL